MPAAHAEAATQRRQRQALRLLPSPLCQLVQGGSYIKPNWSHNQRRQTSSAALCTLVLAVEAASSPPPGPTAAAAASETSFLK